MSGHAERVERAAVVASRQTEGSTPAARLTQAQQQAVAERPVMLIDELAEKLETSSRTILRQLRAGTFFIPEAPKVDKRHRWSRARVYLAIADETLDTHRRSLLGPRGVPQRKTPGEAARERGAR